MASKTLVLVLLCVVIAAVTAQRGCGPNEEFKSCGSCDKRCDNPHPFCINSCQTGCFCKDGHARNSGGHCVPERECH